MVMRINASDTLDIKIRRVETVDLYIINRMKHFMELVTASQLGESIGREFHADLAYRPKRAMISKWRE